MILDTFLLHSVVLQASYEPAYELWDTAGEIARELTKIWGSLKIAEGIPQRQTLNGDNVAISTSIDNGVVNVFRDRASLASMVPSFVRTYDVWRNLLKFSDLSRVSARSIYVKNFESFQDANRFVLDLNLIKWPSSKIFNQNPDSVRSGPDITFRFQDEQTFTNVRIRAENLIFKAELDKDFVKDNTFDVEKSRVVLDFDRGNTGKIAADKLRIDEWFDGYRHVLRRDISKVLGGE